MRISMVIPHDLAEMGETQQHAQRLAAELRALGDEVWVLGPSSGKVALGAWTVGFRGVVNLPAGVGELPVGALVRPWEVERFFRHWRFDVMHLVEPLVPALSFYAAWSAQRTPTVCSFHDPHEPASLAARIARRLWSRVVLGACDRAIAATAPAERRARSLWQGPLILIPDATRDDSAPSEGRALALRVREEYLAAIAARAGEEVAALHRLPRPPGDATP